MKVLFLSDGIPPFIMGGMQKHSLNSVKYLVKNNVSIHLIHCVWSNDTIPSTEEVVSSIFGTTQIPEGFSHECLKFPPAGKLPGHYIRASKQYSRAIYALIKDQLKNFDFVYIQGFSGWELLEHKADHPQLKTGVHFHGLEMFQQHVNTKEKLKSKLLVKPVRKNIQLADYNFSLGGKLNTILLDLGVKKERIIEIPGGIDQAWISKSIERKQLSDQLKVLFVGRYERRKAIDEIYEAIRNMNADLEISFDFVGPIPESAQLKSSLVSYSGMIKSSDEIMKKYQESDVLLCPSFSEGMPNVILEAMSQKCAVLATDVGANSLLINEETGYLITENSSETIKNTLIKISENRNQLAEKQQKSFELIRDKFSWEIVAQQTIEFLKQFERADSK